MTATETGECHESAYGRGDIWLSVNFDLPQTEHYPTVRFVSPAELAVLRYRGLAAARAEDDVISLYQDLTQTILLRTGWDAGNVADLSALVHELAHHLQSEARSDTLCPEAREELAFKAQEQWLGLFGSDLKSVRAGRLQRENEDPLPALLSWWFSGRPIGARAYHVDVST